MVPRAWRAGTRFLNLFAYTGTGTCYAADGGAFETTTVDISGNYLKWARRNMEQNGFGGRAHEFVQTEVMDWVAEQRHTANRWDLIYVDPPTFSNSARMRKKGFDVQEDHTELLIGASRLLVRGGHINLLVQPAWLQARHREAAQGRRRARGRHRGVDPARLRAQRQDSPLLHRAQDGRIGERTAGFDGRD